MSGLLLSTNAVHGRGELVEEEISAAFHSEGGITGGRVRINNEPINWGEFADEADLPAAVSVIDHDHARIVPPFPESPYSVRRLGSDWVANYLREQGVVKGASEPTGYDGFWFEYGDSTYIARVWNGLSTDIEDQPWHVTAAGDVRMAGTLEAGSISIPGVGEVGAHINSSGGASFGTTTAAGVAAGDVQVAGNIYLTTAGVFRTAPVGEARWELGESTGFYGDAGEFSYFDGAGDQRFSIRASTLSTSVYLNFQPLESSGQGLPYIQFGVDASDSYYFRIFDFGLGNTAGFGITNGLIEMEDYGFYADYWGGTYPPAPPTNDLWGGGRAWVYLHNTGVPIDPGDEQWIMQPVYMDATGDVHPWLTVDQVQDMIDAGGAGGGGEPGRSWMGI